MEKPPADTRKRHDEKTKAVTPPQKRHHGLINQGATCDLNSVLQLLFMTPEFNDRLDPEQQTDLQLRKIFEDLKKTTCGTKEITTTFGIKNVHHQRDAAECLETILRQVSTKASEVFRVQVRETTRCSRGHMIKEETRTFRTLLLSLKDSTFSVESSFKRTFQETTYTGNNKLYCNKCFQHKEATRGCEMVEAPQILILHLKRFDFDSNTRSHLKSDCCVEVPCELQLKNKTYKLYGMVNHMDSRGDGHYTATVQSEDNTWYKCNDSHVSKVEEQLFAEDRTFSSRTVYLLTYRATELKMSCKTRLNEEDEVETGNENEVLNHQTAGEEENTEENSNDKYEWLKEIKSGVSCKRRLDEETTTDREGQGAPKKPRVTILPSQTGDAAERRDETSKPDDQMQPEVEQTGDDAEMDTNEEEKRQMGHSDIVTQTQRPDYDPNNQGASHSLNSVPQAPEMHDRNRTVVEDASEQLKDSCEHLDEETKTDEEQRAAECQKPVETISEDPTEVEEEQGEDTGPEDLKEDEEPKRNSEGNTDDEETTQMGQSAEDEGQMRKDGEGERLQARGEEGDAENVETDTSINDQTVSEVKSSAGEETQENKDSNTRENNKSEELNETRVEDASVDVGEQSKDSCEHLDEETKTEEEQRVAECQKPVETTSEDLTEVEEEQGEDTGPEDLKEDEEPRRNTERNTDDEETTQMGQSAEDEGQMTTDRKEERLQARGEEGDAENVETDTSINNQTVSEVKSSAGEETQENEDSNTQENKSEELNETRREDTSVDVGEQLKDSCEHLDEETKTEEEQRAAECQKPVETTSEDPTEVEEEQGEDTGPEELKEDEEPRRNSEGKTDDEETTQMGHSAEDEGQMRKDRKEERLQARGEEGDAENVETDTSINNQTVSEVKSSVGEETQENEDNNTRENSKSEELNETRVEDASVNVGEQLKDSCEHLDEETKTDEEQRAAECQKPVETTSEDPTEVEEEQGEDTGPEDLKEDEEPRRNSKRNTDDEETTQMGQSAEDEGQMTTDRKEERLQARGEEGDAENVETDTSINNQTVSEVKSSEGEETQENEDSNTRENKKSEELNGTRVEDTSVNVGEQSKDSCERLDDETKTEEEQRVAPPQKPHHGLYNQGATCYLNSVLQLLFMTTEIHDRLDPQTNQELIKIFKDLKTKTCGTENITKCLQIQNVCEQRDAAECLQEILHHMSPQASEVFQGQLMDTTKCSEGHIINNETNPFWILPLPLKDAPDTTYSVKSSFERTFQTTTYSGDNTVYCNHCRKKTEATSGCEMVEAPQILILLLKRFDFNFYTRSHFKSDCCVEVPCELQLKNKTYKLYGMVNHMGSIRGGHYTATVQSEDNTWYECNDSHVSKVKYQLFAEDRTFSSRTVYLLTYRATEFSQLEELRQDDVELKETFGQKDAKDKGNIRQNEEDEVETTKDDEILNHQTEGEEDNTEENSNEKSEGLKETKSKNSSEHHLGEETKTDGEEQKGLFDSIRSFFKSPWKYFPNLQSVRSLLRPLQWILPPRQMR